MTGGQVVLGFELDVLVPVVQCVRERKPEGLGRGCANERRFVFHAADSVRRGSLSQVGSPKFLRAVPLQRTDEKVGSHFLLMRRPFAPFLVYHAVRCSFLPWMSSEVSSNSVSPTKHAGACRGFVIYSTRWTEPEMVQLLVALKLGVCVPQACRNTQFEGKENESPLPYIVPFSMQTSAAIDFGIVLSAANVSGRGLIVVRSLVLAQECSKTMTIPSVFGTLWPASSWGSILIVEDDTAVISVKKSKQKGVYSEDFVRGSACMLSRRREWATSLIRAGSVLRLSEVLCSGRDDNYRKEEGMNESNLGVGASGGRRRLERGGRETCEWFVDGGSVDVLLGLTSRLIRICELRAGCFEGKGGGGCLSVGRLLSSSAVCVFRGCVFGLNIGGGMGGFSGERGRALRRLIAEEERYQMLLRQMAERFFLGFNVDGFAAAAAAASGGEAANNADKRRRWSRLITTLLQGLSRNSSPLYSSILSHSTTNSNIGGASDPALIDDSLCAWPTISAGLSAMLWESEQWIPTVIVSHGGTLVDENTVIDKRTTHIIDTPLAHCRVGESATLPTSPSSWSMYDKNCAHMWDVDEESTACVSVPRAVARLDDTEADSGRVGVMSVGDIDAMIKAFVNCGGTTQSEAGRNQQAPALADLEGVMAYFVSLYEGMVKCRATLKSTMETAYRSYLAARRREHKVKPHHAVTVSSENKDSLSHGDSKEQQLPSSSSVFSRRAHFVAKKVGGEDAAAALIGSPSSPTNAFSDYLTPISVARDLSLLEGIVDPDWVRMCVRYGRVLPPTICREVFDGTDLSSKGKNDERSDEAEVDVKGITSTNSTSTSSHLLSSTDRYVLGCIKEVWDLIKEHQHDECTTLTHSNQKSLFVIAAEGSDLSALSKWLEENAIDTKKNTKHSRVKQSGRKHARGGSEGKSLDAKTPSRACTFSSVKKARCEAVGTKDVPQTVGGIEKIAVGPKSLSASSPPPSAGAAPLPPVSGKFKFKSAANPPLMPLSVKSAKAPMPSAIPPPAPQGNASAAIGTHVLAPPPSVPATKCATHSKHQIDRSPSSSSASSSSSDSSYTSSSSSSSPDRSDYREGEEDEEDTHDNDDDDEEDMLQDFELIYSQDMSFFKSSRSTIIPSSSSFEYETPPAIHPFDTRTESLLSLRSPYRLQMLMAITLMPPALATDNQSDKEGEGKGGEEGHSGGRFSSLTSEETYSHLPYNLFTTSADSAPWSSAKRRGDALSLPVGWWTTEASATSRSASIITPYLPMQYLAEWCSAQGLEPLPPAVLTLLAPDAFNLTNSRAGQAATLVPYSPYYFIPAYQPDMKTSRGCSVFLGLRRGRRQSRLLGSADANKPPSFCRPVKQSNLGNNCPCDAVSESKLRFAAKVALLQQDARDELELYWKGKAGEAANANAKLVMANTQLQASHEDLVGRYVVLGARVAVLEERIHEEQRLRATSTADAELAFMEMEARMLQMQSERDTLKAEVTTLRISSASWQDEEGYSNYPRSSPALHRGIGNRYLKGIHSQTCTTAAHTRNDSENVLDDSCVRFPIQSSSASLPYINEKRYESDNAMRVLAAREPSIPPSPPLPTEDVGDDATVEDSRSCKFTIESVKSNNVGTSTCKLANVDVGLKAIQRSDDRTCKVTVTATLPSSDVSSGSPKGPAAYSYSRPLVTQQSQHSDIPFQATPLFSPSSPSSPSSLGARGDVETNQFAPQQTATYASSSSPAPSSALYYSSSYDRGKKSETTHATLQPQFDFMTTTVATTAGCDPAKHTVADSTAITTVDSTSLPTTHLRDEAGWSSPNEDSSSESDGEVHVQVTGARRIVAFSTKGGSVGGGFLGCR